MNSLSREEEIKKQLEFMQANPGCKSKGLAFYRKFVKRKYCEPKKKKKKNKIKEPNLLKTLKKFRGGLTKQATRHEILFKSMLKILDIKFEFQKIFIVNKKGYIADFYLIDYKFVIEIDGTSHNDQEAKDENRTNDLLSTGLVKQVLRFDNDEVESMNEIDLSMELTLKICPFAELFCT
uniref:DUF559 domain-containing protein n=1 Tax=viral metagenome TaxID=1070528 RepID=A0A6M3KYE0_9ZZZZ